MKVSKEYLRKLIRESLEQEAKSETEATHKLIKLCDMMLYDLRLAKPDLEQVVFEKIRARIFQIQDLLGVDRFSGER